MSTFTDTDLTVLEGLDFAPPCESWRGCDQAAAWVAEMTPHYCGKRHTQLLCTPHLESWVSSFGRMTIWKCSRHDAEAAHRMTWHEAHILHRIEAL